MNPDSLLSDIENLVYKHEQQIVEKDREIERLKRELNWKCRPLDFSNLYRDRNAKIESIMNMIQLLKKEIVKGNKIVDPEELRIWNEKDPI